MAKVHSQEWCKKKKEQRFQTRRLLFLTLNWRHLFLFRLLFFFLPLPLILITLVGVLKYYLRRQECGMEMHQMRLPNPFIRQQQRLFTGSLFPEEVNDKLCSFAQRHNLKSHVWIPRRAFEGVLKLYHVYIYPSAVFCDTSISLISTSYSEALCAMGRDFVLVNADHTSNPTLLECFRDFLVPHPKSQEMTTSTLFHRVLIHNFLTHSRALPGPELITQRFTESIPKPCDNLNSFALPKQSFGGFMYPLTTTGIPISKKSTIRTLFEIQSQMGYRMNYWIPTHKNFKSKGYTNVEETLYPGRFNPTWCVHYEPHTRTNQSFPQGIRRLMIQRAVEHGYVSRLWVTLKEAEEVYRTTLLPEHAQDSPPIFCNAFSGGLDSLQFFCADQFIGSDSLFCNYREADLSANGVLLSPDKMRGFPLLRGLVCSSLSHDNFKVRRSRFTSSTLTFDGQHTRSDVTLVDSERHIRFAKTVALYKDIRLFGFRSRRMEQNYLDRHHFREKLSKHCILCGFATPHFIHTKIMTDYRLLPASQQVGFLHVPGLLRLGGKFAWLQHLSWFNIAQLAEPLVALMLFYKHPIDTFTGEGLIDSMATQCTRLQLLHQYHSREWVSDHIIGKLGGSIRPAAPGVRYMSEVASTNNDFYPFSHRRPVFFNLDEVDLLSPIKEWLRRYCPVDNKGHSFARPVHTLLKLRAFEGSYHSAVWVVIKPFSGYRLKRSNNSAVEATPSEVGHTSACTLVVQYKHFLLANEEDVECCSEDALLSVSDEKSIQHDNKDDFFILFRDEHKSEPFVELRESTLG